MKFFILGILFVSVFSPILDSLTGLAVQAIQFLTAKIAVKAYALKKKIEDLEENKSEEEAEKHYGFYSLPDPQILVEQEDQDESDDE